MSSMGEQNGHAIVKRGVGRPTKRTPEVEAHILRALRVGLSYENAAKMAGIGATTLDEWIADDDDFRALCERTRVNMGRRCAHYLLEQARKGNVTAAIFLLKVRFEEFRENKETGDGDDAIAERRKLAEETAEAVNRIRQRADMAPGLN